MHKYTYPILVLVALFTAFLWQRSIKAEARAEALAQVRADSITFVLAQYDSSYAAEDSVRSILVDSIAQLSAGAAKMRLGLAQANQASDSALAVLGIRLDADSIQDSTRAAITSAVAALQEEIYVCNGILINCEQRAEAFAAIVARDTVALAAARANTMRYASLYREEILRKRPTEIIFSVTPGVGVFSAGGEIRTGIGVVLGISIPIFRLKLPRLF